MILSTDCDWSFLLRNEVAGHAFFPFFLTTEATAIRGVNRELKRAVAQIQWNDDEQIHSSLAAWRACFPRALRANIEGRTDLTDAAFVHLAGIHTLDMSWCDQATITDAVLVHLEGAHRLEAFGCDQLDRVTVSRLHDRSMESSMKRSRHV